jgi:hypothetical protein
MRLPPGPKGVPIFGSLLEMKAARNDPDLTAIPVSFDLPQKYDQDGQPFGQELREKWRERREYIEMVILAKLRDSLFSACLSSKRSQTIAYVYGT